MSKEENMQVGNIPKLFCPILALLILHIFNMPIMGISFFFRKKILGGGESQKTDFFKNFLLFFEENTMQNGFYYIF